MKRVVRTTLVGILAVAGLTAAAKQTPPPNAGLPQQKAAQHTELVISAPQQAATVATLNLATLQAKDTDAALATFAPMAVSSETEMFAKAEYMSTRGDPGDPCPEVACRTSFDSMTSATARAPVANFGSKSMGGAAGMAVGKTTAAGSGTQRAGPVQATQDLKAAKSLAFCDPHC